MTPLKIVLDVERPPGLEVDPSRLIHQQMARIGAIGLLRNGTDRGRATVAIRVDLPDGTQVLAETTWRLLWLAAHALAAGPVGAEEVLDP